MNPHTGEILAMANEPTFNPNAYPRVRRRPTAATAPCRISTSRDRRSRSSPRRRRIEEKRDADRHDDRHAARASSASTRVASSPTTPPQLRRAVVHRRHRQVEQHRRDQDRLRVGTERLSRLRRAVRLRRVRCRPTFPARAPASSGAPDKWTDSALRLGVDGLSGRRDAAADGGGRQRGGQRRRATSSRASFAPSTATTAATPSHAEDRAPDDQRRHRGDADDDHGRRRRTARHRERPRRFRGYTIAGKTGTAREAGQRPLLARPTTTRRLSASCRRAIRRSRSSSSPIRRTTARLPAAGVGAGLQAASPRRRCAISASAPTINPAVAGARGAHERPGDRRDGGAAAHAAARWSARRRRASPARCPICAA